MTERATECQSEPGRRAGFLHWVDRHWPVVQVWLVASWLVTGDLGRSNPTGWWSTLAGVLLVAWLAGWLSVVAAYRHRRRHPVPTLHEQVRRAVATPWYERRRRHNPRAR